MSLGNLNDSNLARARRRLDQRLAALRPTTNFAVPPKGWIRAIRDALGMSGRQLAARLRVSPQNVAKLEVSEANGTIQLETLRRVAESLDCRLVYALVPNTSLEEMVWQRARKVASHEIGRVSHSMTLEDQQVDDGESEEEVRRYVRRHVREKDLWDD